MHFSLPIKSKGFALSLVLVSGLVGAAQSQTTGGFTDQPDNHWASDALKRLHDDGILVGYPDGAFRGSRPATRYEMAVAINAAYQRLKELTDALTPWIQKTQQQLDDLEKNGGGKLPEIPPDLVDSIKAISAYGDDIKDLKRMSEMYEKELTQLGVDVAQMQTDLGKLSDRVGALEHKALPIAIHGDFTSALIGGYGTSGQFGITIDGRPTGFGRGSYFAQPVGINRDLTALEEAGIELDTTSKTGPRLKFVAASGNLFGNGVTQSQTTAGIPFMEGTNDLYIQNLEISFDKTVAGLNLNARVGRIGLKMSPYVFYRPPVNPYFHSARWDNGEWDVDGAQLSLPIGSNGKLSLFAARTSDQKSSSGIAFQPMTAGYHTPAFQVGGGIPLGIIPGTISVDQTLGANVDVPLGNKASVNLAYLLLDSNTVTYGANRVNVYGGDLNLGLGSVKVTGGYDKSDLYYNSTKINSSFDARFGGLLTYDASRWGLTAGYREIDPLYNAPGYWGRIGAWWNPTGLKGFQVGGHYDLTKTLSLSANGEFYTGTGQVASAMSTDDKLNHYITQLTYKSGPQWTFGVGYERIDWNLADRAGFTGGKPMGQGYDLGFGYALSRNSMFQFLWEISDYNSNGVQGFDLGGHQQAKGGLITTQLTIKI